MKKGKLSTIILIFVFLAGLSLLLYPTISEYWNSLHQSKAIVEYAEQVAELNDDVYSQLWLDAENYNRALLDKADRYTMSDQEKEEYESQLNVSGNGIIGYIEIPTINCFLPIYHGTDESVLQVAIGHIAGTSFPVGGEGTHCVLSGHRGLPSAKLFSNLDQLAEGDTFILHVLDEMLTYEVDQIRIVEPHEMSDLDIEEGKDYCTLVTCTPYGINTHRLLVRGHRVGNAETVENVRITADAMQIESVVVAPVIAVPVLLLLLIAFLVTARKKHKGG